MVEIHNKVRLVARDRANAYASAISEILPDCVQVADQFHYCKIFLNI
ncbi:MAG: transposase [Enterocloster sp.]